MYTAERACNHNLNKAVENLEHDLLDEACSGGCLVEQGSEAFQQQGKD